MDTFLAFLVSVGLALAPMLIFAAVLLWVDRYEKEPWWLVLGVFLWGLIVAGGGALVVNTVFGIGMMAVTGDQTVAMGSTAVVSAPLVEETIKGLAVLIVFLFFRHEFDSLLDGIIYGALVGLGFAATENFVYAFLNGYLAGEGGGWQGLWTAAAGRGFIPFLHPFLTSFTGLGLAAARLNRNWLVGSLLALGGYGLAIAFHFLHNLLSVMGGLFCLFGITGDWIGYLGMGTLIIVLVWRESKIMRDYLQEEVKAGVLTTEQWQTASSIIGQFSARWGALFQGRGGTTNKIYDLCGELAFKKYQVATLGSGEAAKYGQQIEALRGKLANLNRQP